jgi:hypothetical protein
MITALHDGYSERNATLIAMQDPEATDVSGFKAWQDRGRAVMARDRWPAGTDSIKILAPAGQRDAQAADAQAGTPEVKARRFFRIATVFDVRLTEPLADAKARWEAQAAERELAPKTDADPRDGESAEAPPAELANA